MLAGPQRHRCIECGLIYGSDRFHYYHGRIEEGPAYWCDRGVLCSPKCALVHHDKRRAEGTQPQTPAPDPFDVAPVRKR